jgi:hypothetical protein
LFEYLFDHLQGILVPSNIEVNHQIPITSGNQKFPLSKKYESLVQLGSVPYFCYYTCN